VTPKVNIFYAVSREKVHGPFFFTETTVTGDSFLDMLENWLLPQLNTNYDEYIPQLDRASPHFHVNVRVLLNRVLPQHWIRRAVNGDNNLLPSPPLLPDLTPCDFFLVCSLKTVFICHHCLRPSRNCSDNACIAGHYSRHATPNVG
jgi:hypothetical protein